MVRLELFVKVNCLLTFSVTKASAVPSAMMVGPVYVWYTLAASGSRSSAKVPEPEIVREALEPVIGWVIVTVSPPESVTVVIWVSAPPLERSSPVHVAACKSGTRNKKAARVKTEKELIRLFIVASCIFKSRNLKNSGITLRLNYTPNRQQFKLN